ncbi:MAG TPA: type II toxin-antitoxin system RelE/ParE family toxin [Fibrobacteria bacterium]|nr:type II toxin-antitoxin system RelE/ParE family toxin [Fibrobacteria bacterium]
MKIRLHPEASKEVAEAVLWYEGQQAGLGQRFADEAEAAIYRIAAFPNINSEIGKGLRRGMMPIFPFGIMGLHGIEWVILGHFVTCRLPQAA